MKHEQKTEGLATTPSLNNTKGEPLSDDTFDAITGGGATNYLHIQENPGASPTDAELLGKAIDRKRVRYA